MTEIKERIQGLILQYGPEKVNVVIEELISKAERSIAGPYAPVIEADRIEGTIAQLDAAVSDVLEAGKAVDQAYKDKGQLMKRKLQLETDIKLEEAQAIMDIRGEARSQYVMVGAEKVLLTNDTARDAYRRLASKEPRKALAQVEAELAALDVALEKAKEARNTTKEANDSIRAKASVQAALLNYLK